jgi:carbon monoxide dehydrogenase subunit G
MKFTNQFHVPLPLEQAWALMLDVPRILPCLPGAKLTEVIDGNKYRGSVSVKLGPIKLAFDGQAEMVRTDPEQHIAYLQGAGLDPKGRGSAQSEFSFALTPAGGGTDVTVTTDLQLSGAVAQYGRGSGMIAEVASHILAQFERNLAASLQPQDPWSTPDATATASPGSTAAAPSPANTTTPLPPTAGAAQTPPAISSLEAQAVLLQTQALLAQSQAVLSATQQALLRFQAMSASHARNAQPQELNMLSIGAKAMWSQIKHSIGTLFGRKP